MEICYIHGSMLVPEDRWNSAIFMEHCVCAEKVWNFGYIHGSVLVPEEGGILAIYLLE